MVQAMKDDLARFLIAQEPVYAQVVAELEAGDKASHWIWFIFPQLRSLGRSSTAHFYGLEDLEETQRYLKHPVLASRLRGCSLLLLKHSDKTSLQILGEIDSLKVRSCMTLFALATDDPSVFHSVLDQFYKGQPCPLTLEAPECVWPF